MICKSGLKCFFFVCVCEEREDEGKKVFCYFGENMGKVLSVRNFLRDRRVIDFVFVY